MTMQPQQITVFFPCHSLEDFPTWLEGPQADDLLAAWTAAWHPALIAAAGCIPTWASIDSPPHVVARSIYIVPAAFDSRLAGDFAGTFEVCMIRWAVSRSAIVAESLSKLDAPAVVCAEHAAELHAIGLAWLLGELLARRMRSVTNLASTRFGQAVVDAAKAAVLADEETFRERLKEAYGFLEAARAQYYPADFWLLDLVLLAESTLGDELQSEIDSPVVATWVADAHLIESLSEKQPQILSQLREAVESGRIAPAGGSWDASPVANMAPETLLNDLKKGQALWTKLVGQAPRVYARRTGGFSALLPQVLSGLGYSGVLYMLFDGMSLPDPHTGRIRWEGTGSVSIDALARTPLDARSTTTILSLAEKIGDAMDHDHTAAIAFAHFPENASPWFQELRIIGRSSTLLGSFVTVDEFFRRTTGSGTRAHWEPDAFRTETPSESGDAIEPDVLSKAIENHVAEALRICLAQQACTFLIPTPCEQQAAVPTVLATSVKETVPFTKRSWFKKVFSSTHKETSVVLDNGLVKLKVHPRTGGILSLQGPLDRANLLSQQLSRRSTRATPPTGSAWVDPSDRAEYSLMKADSIIQTRNTELGQTAESRGHLQKSDGSAVGSFVQTMSLERGSKFVILDIQLELESAPQGRLFEEYAACRFAWSENEDVSLRRSLHTQSIATQRTQFFSSHFIDLHHCGHGITLFPIGLPWHLQSSPHMLDTLLIVRGETKKRFRLAVGVGVERPFESAIDLACSTASSTPQGESSWESDPFFGPANVRVGVMEAIKEGNRTSGVRLGILESLGKAGRVAVQSRVPIVAAWRCDAAGKRGESIELEGNSILMDLTSYEWAFVVVEFTA